MQTLYNALIRTHHITSRKKVAALKRAADTHQCAVLLRSGGCPGIMYVEGGKEPVESWVDVVRRLRYKDFQLVTRPGVVEEECECGKQRTGNGNGEKKGGKELDLPLGLDEVESVKEFGGIMAKRGCGIGGGGGWDMLDHFMGMELHLWCLGVLYTTFGDIQSIFDF